MYIFAQIFNLNPKSNDGPNNIYVSCFESCVTLWLDFVLAIRRSKSIWPQVRVLSQILLHVASQNSTQQQQHINHKNNHYLQITTDPIMYVYFMFESCIPLWVVFVLAHGSLPNQLVSAGSIPATKSSQSLKHIRIIYNYPWCDNTTTTAPTPTATPLETAATNSKSKHSKPILIMCFRNSVSMIIYSFIVLILYFYYNIKFQYYCSFWSNEWKKMFKLQILWQIYFFGIQQMLF